MESVREFDANRTDLHVVHIVSEPPKAQSIKTRTVACIRRSTTINKNCRWKASDGTLSGLSTNTLTKLSAGTKTTAFPAMPQTSALASGNCTTTRPSARLIETVNTDDKHRYLDALAE